MISRRRFLRHGLGAAALVSGPALLSRMLTAEPAPPGFDVGGLYKRALVIDTLTPDGPNFDPQAAMAAGLTAAVVDLRMFPRNFPGAVDALADWSSAFH